MKKYYLAYGSNLNLSQMAYRCPSAKPIGTINLEGYRLAFRGGDNGYAYLTIEPDENSSIPMGLFELSFFDIKNLDVYEGYPDFYYKDTIPVKVGDKNIRALIYIMNKGFDYHLPSYKYIKTCIEGYRDFGFNPELLKKAYEDTYNFMNSPKLK